MQQRRLAGPIGADQAERLPGGELQVDSVQHFAATVSGDQAIDTQHRLRTGKLGDPLGIDVPVDEGLDRGRKAAGGGARGNRILPVRPGCCLHQRDPR